MTEALRTPQGTMSLFPHQALALYELGRHRCAFGGALGVGSGKTLISLLAARVLRAKRPLLLVPGELKRKTEAEMATLARHWQIPVASIRIMSYERLSLAHAGPELDAMAPDLFVFDEAHMIKTWDAGRVKKLRRHHAARREAAANGGAPLPVCLPLTGTMTGKELAEIQHLAEWALGPMSFLPIRDDDPESYRDTLASWGESLDMGDNPRHPGALLAIGKSAGIEAMPGEDPISTARRGLAERIRLTPGVIVAHCDEIDASILTSAKVVQTPPDMAGHWERLRSKWERPDGKMLVDSLEIGRLYQQLSVGLYYRWIEDGPDDWMTARKAWGQRLRRTLDHSQRLDTPHQVEDLAEAEGWDEWATWKAARDLPRENGRKFEPETEPVWLSDHYLELAEKWAKKFPGVVWAPLNIRAVGQRLLERGKIGRYFADGGACVETGQLVMDCRDRNAICSAKACSTGHNLQHWHRSLVLYPPSSCTWWQQGALGRFHRPGQTADTVYCDVLLACTEARKSLSSALDGARRADELGNRQKLLVGDRAGFDARPPKGGAWGPAWPY
jgi:hypothetical protein